MQIFLNGQELELATDAKVAITLQANDIADISKANTSYTNKFELPRTAGNTKILEYLGINGSATRIPYSLTNVNLFEDSLPLVVNGYCNIEQTSPTSYSMNIYGSEKSLFELLKQYSIQDIFPDTNVVWSAPNLLQYTTGTTTFCFPVAQYNANTTSSSFIAPSIFTTTEVMRSSPHFFVKYIWDQIFENLGYVVEYPMVADEDFSKLVIPSKKGISHFPFVNHGDTFNVKQLVHDVGCDVFIREIMQRYGLVVKCNEFTKTVTFTRMEDMLSTSQVVDWSDKVDSIVSSKYSIGSYAQKNLFKYGEDVADEKFPYFFPAEQLQGSFEIDNALLPRETTVLESTFQKSKAWGELTGATAYEMHGRFFHPPDFSLFGHFLFDVSENTKDEESTELSPKEIPFQLMYLQGFPSPAGVAFTFSSPLGTTHTATVPIRVCTNYHIDWQYYIDRHYGQLNNLFNTMEVVKVKMNISTIDIYQLDFFKRIYLEQFGSCFFLNKISNWQKNKVVEVELVKIPPFEA
ncbi:hypothetical protein [Flavobacterium sp.]|uniref:hypothetical protein n=1 Tax=Flavobacterium sp. TaxID=239 RepID=UPI00403333AD